MARKKDPMALFEVLSKSQNPRNTMHVPDWAKRKVDQAAEADTSVEQAGEQQPQGVDADAIEEYESEHVAPAAPETPENVSKYQKGASFLQKLAARREAAKAEQSTDLNTDADVVEDVAIDEPTTPASPPPAADAVELDETVDEPTTEDPAQPDPGDTEIGVAVFFDDQEATVESAEAPVAEAQDPSAPTASGLFSAQDEEPLAAEQEPLAATDETETESEALAESPADETDEEVASEVSNVEAPQEHRLAASEDQGEECTASDSLGEDRPTDAMDDPDVIEDATPTAVSEHIEQASPRTADAPTDATSEGWAATARAAFFAWRPRVHLHEDEVEISVRLIPAMFALGTVLVLMVLTFVLGRVTAPGESVRPEISEQQDAASSETGPVETETPEQPAMVGLNPLSTDPPVLAPPKQRDPGRNYLVIQMLAGADDADYDEAMRIQSFMDEQGVPVDAWTVSVNGKPRLMVWSRLGFESPTSREAESLVDRVEHLGKQYFQKYQTYDFRQRVDGRRRPFFVRGDKVNPKQDQS